MKPRSLFFPRHITCATAAGVLLASAALPAYAASATWNGTTDATWATGTNWSAIPVPGTGDTATFNNAGGSDDVINLGAGVTINALLFDTASVAAYTIGSGAVGSQTLTLNDGGTITLNSTIAQNQLINANLALGTGVAITNNDASNTLTIAGNVSGASSTLTKAGSGTVILSGANTYGGGTTVSGGVLSTTFNSTINSLGIGAVLIDTGTTLQINNTNTASGTPTIGNAFTGSGLLQLVMAASNKVRNTAFTGLTGFTGTIRLSAAGASKDKWNANNLGTIHAALIIDSGTTYFATGGTTTFTNGITVSGVGNGEGRGAIRLASELGGNITLAGDTTIGNDNNAGVLTGDITASVNSTLTFNRTSNFLHSGSLGGGAGTLSVNKSGTSGTHTFSGSLANFTGTYTQVGGATNLTGTASATIGTAATDWVINGGTLVVDSSANQTLAGDITGTAGAFTKTGTGTLTISSTSNSYGGVTNITGGTLAPTTAAALSAYNVLNRVVFNGGTLAVQVGGSGWTAGQVDTLLSNATKTSGVLAIDTTTGNLTLSTNSLSGGIGLTKLGGNTLTLDQAASYTGTTTLGGGTLALTQDTSLTGGLIFGATEGNGTVSTLNLNSANATFAGTMRVRTETASAATSNVITIGANRTLTTGSVQVGETPADNAAGGFLIVSGAGAWDVISSDGTFGATGSTNNQRSDINLSGLADFNADLRTTGDPTSGGLFQVGNPTGGATQTRDNIVRLATDSTISADLVRITNSAQPGLATLQLGNGTQIINSDSIIMSAGTGGGRGNSAFNFRTADGTLKIRGTDGGIATRSSLTMQQSSSGGGNKTSTFDVTGHDADLLFDTIRIYDSTASTDISATDVISATFSFDRGTLDAATFEIGRKSAGDLNSFGNATANIGSSSNHTNTATLGTVNMGILTTGGNISVNGELRSTLNIAGTATTVNYTTMSVLNSSSANANAKVASAVNISGGTTTGTGGIDMATAFNAGTGSSTLTISGGSLSVGTGGVSAANGIYRTATSANATTTLVLNGGSLDLNGNNIGGAGANAITTQFESGTLSNVGEINGGGDLTKTTGGTLALAGTNTYTGATLVSAGTLLVNGSLGNTAVTVESGASFGGSGSFAGSLSLDAGSKLDLTGATLGLTSSDILTAGGSSSITLNDFAFSSIIGWDYANAANGTYTLINGGSGVTLAGTTPTSSNPFDFGNGKSGYFQSGSLQAVIIPEPRAALLGSLGMLMLIRRRRA